MTVAVLATALASGAPAHAGKPPTDAPTISVSDVEQLYTAVNNPANAGAVIMLTPNVYVLSTTNANGGARTNRGRLDLQLDMSLVGVEGNRDAVVIDTSRLPAAAFAFPPAGRTGSIRIGRGNNHFEWLTIAGNTNAAVAISTDLVQRDILCGDGTQPGACPTAIRVAHVAASGTTRGVDIRNVTTNMNGRRLVAELVGNEFYWGHEGIRVANFSGADNAEIRVRMRGNHCHQNTLGCIIENNRSSNASIAVQSEEDIFEDNGLGGFIGGAIASSGMANLDTTRFDGYHTVFANNTRTSFNPDLTGPEFDSGGLLVPAATVIQGTPPYSVSSNAVIVRLWDCQIAGNRLDGRDDFEVAVLGAQSYVPVSGDLTVTDNHALVQLRGTTSGVEALEIDREPAELDASNTATIVRIPKSPGQRWHATSPQ